MRCFDAKELVSQIGFWNLGAISGGRVQVTAVDECGAATEVTLPVGQGYKVVISLGWDDTYTVQRVFRNKVKGEVTGVYFDEIGEVAYVASCFVNREFGEKVVA